MPYLHQKGGESNEAHHQSSDHNQSGDYRRSYLWPRIGLG